MGTHSTRHRCARAAGFCCGLGVLGFFSVLGVFAASAPVLATRAIKSDEPVEAAETSAQIERSAQDARVHAFIRAWCIDCHAGDDAEGEFDLHALLTRSNHQVGASGVADPPRDLEKWLAALRRVEDGEMPPRKAPQPPAAEIEAFASALRHAQPGIERTPRATTPVVRRLTRGEYRRSVRDLFETEINLGELLPTDDPGNGFDTASDGLSLSPLAVERFIVAAERVALAIAPDERSWQGRWIFEGTQLVREGAGSMTDGAQMLWGSGRISASLNAPVAGSYRIRVRSWGQQAGTDPVRLAIRVGNRRTIDTIDVPNERDDPLTSEHTSDLSAGKNRIDVVFVNDFWQPDHPDPRQRDRNAAVVSIEVEGPLEPPPLPPSLKLEQGEELDDARVDAFVASVAARAFRRPVDEQEVRALTSIAGSTASPRARLNGAIAAMLASPSFILRADSALPRGYGDAARLAGFLWSSVPDEELLQSAAAGRLHTPAGRAVEARRMLADPRSRALAEEFATQWLAVRELDRRVPDPTRFPEVDAALLASMREETIRWFDAILREKRPLRELISADWTLMNEALMQHGGYHADASLGAPDQDGWRRVRVERGGVLRQPSILLATSNPTRTSPVKRGRFVLDALLDEAPPPPPPGVPQLPESADGHEASLVELMERHRSDPACAACHRSMDSIGLLLEEFDAVGRPRRATPMQAELPDGRIVNSSKELVEALLEDAALARTVARRLMVFATGRSLSPSVREACDRLVDELGADATLHELIVRLVELDAFLPSEGANPP